MRLDDGHAAGAVRLFRVRPEEVFVVVGSLRLLLLCRDGEAALGRLAGRHRGRGGRGPHCERMATAAAIGRRDVGVQVKRETDGTSTCSAAAPWADPVEKFQGSETAVWAERRPMIRPPPRHPPLHIRGRGARPLTSYHPQRLHVICFYLL